MAQVETPPQTQQHAPGRPADPCVMAIFGAAGRSPAASLIPALYNLAKSASCFHASSPSSGFLVRHMSDEDFRKKLLGRPSFNSPREPDDVHPDFWEWFTLPVVLRRPASSTTRMLYAQS